MKLRKRKLRKRKLRKHVWAVVDRYYGGGWLDYYTTKREAVFYAEADIRAGYSIHGRLSVVRLTVDADSEVEVSK